MIQKSGIIIRIIVAVTLCVASFTALAQLGDYERDKLLRALHIPTLTKNPAIFDGTTFNPDADPGDAYRFMNAFAQDINKAVKVVNSMSTTGRHSDEGARLIELVREKLEYSKAMTSQFKAFERRKKTQAPATQDKPVTQDKPDNAAPVNKPTASSIAVNANDDSSQIELSHIQNHLDQPGALMASGNYDGTAFDPSLTMEEANVFINQFFDTASAAVAAYNSLPPLAQRSPLGRSMVDEIQTRQGMGKRTSGTRIQ